MNKQISEEEAIRAAKNPSTSEEEIVRLRGLFSRNAKVKRLLAKHPNLPYSMWKKFFLDDSYPEAWDSPYAPLFIFGMNKEESRIVKLNAYYVWVKSVKVRSKLSEDAKGLIHQQIDLWWNDIGAVDIMETISEMNEMHREGFGQFESIDIEQLHEKVGNILVSRGKNSLPGMAEDMTDALREALPPARELFQFTK